LLDLRTLLLWRSFVHFFAPLESIAYALFAQPKNGCLLFSIAYALLCSS
jgi:hypothetical protein